MDYNKVAKDILDNVGGKANVKQVTHCFTRLRFVLRDESKAKKEVVEHLEGVISVVVAGGQFQVVCGAKVTKIYDAVVAQLGGQAASSAEEEAVPAQKQSPGQPHPAEADRDLYSAGARHCSFRPNQGSSGRLCQDARL